MKTITLPAHMTGCIPKVDGSMTIRFATRELSKEEKVLIMEYLNSEGWLLFKDNEVNPSDIPAVDAETGRKTPSQLLRGKIYALWNHKKQMGKMEKSFEVYYRDQLENIGQQFLNKIEN